MRCTSKALTLCGILGLALWGWSEQARITDTRLTVFVSDSAHTPEHFVIEAEQEATRIFRQAGLVVDWINCRQQAGVTPDPHCQQALAPADLIVRILPRALNAPDSAFGVSFLSHSGGVYTDVFLDHVQQLREKDPSLSPSPILGHIIAHELGHLLLGANSHSHDGVMQANWQYPQLRKIAMGQLLFNPKQAAQLRAKVASLRSPLAPAPVIAELSH